MPARAYWQGPDPPRARVDPGRGLCRDQVGAAIAFHQIHEPSGKRINYEKVVRGIGPVDRDEIVKGFEVSKGNYVLLDDDEIEGGQGREPAHARPRAVRRCRRDRRVLLREALLRGPRRRPRRGGLRVVLREALRAASKVGIGQISVRRRETLVGLKPCGKGLVLETLRYEDEVRRAQEYFKASRRPSRTKGLLDLATTLIEQRSAPFDRGRVPPTAMSMRCKKPDRQEGQVEEARRSSRTSRSPRPRGQQRDRPDGGAEEVGVGGEKASGAEKKARRCEEGAPAKKAAPARKRACMELEPADPRALGRSRPARAARGGGECSGCCSGSTARCAEHAAGMRTHGLICFSAAIDDGVDPRAATNSGRTWRGRGWTRCAFSRRGVRSSASSARG